MASPRQVEELSSPQVELKVELKVELSPPQLHSLCQLSLLASTSESRLLLVLSFSIRSQQPSEDVGVDGDLVVSQH